VSYLQDARGYALQIGNAWYLRYSDLNALAHYEIARLDPTYTTFAASFLAADLDVASGNAEREPFGSGVDGFYWGSGMLTLGYALEALYYEDLTHDARYRDFALAQR